MKIDYVDSITLSHNNLPEGHPYKDDSSFYSFMPILGIPGYGIVSSYKDTIRYFRWYYKTNVPHNVDSSRISVLASIIAKKLGINPLRYDDPGESFTRWSYFIDGYGLLYMIRVTDTSLVIYNTIDIEAQSTGNGPLLRGK